jgi:undecaprenyl pyrophosphate synthase
MTIKLSKQETLAIQTAEAIVTVGTAQATIDANCQAIRKARKAKPIGTVKNGCAVMIRFTETLAKAGKSEQTVKNYATAFRKAVNDGVPFSMNAYRAPTKKGAKSTSSNEVSVKVTLKGEPDSETVAKKLREIFNGWKKKDLHAELASFMLDALDEFDGE